MTEFDPNEAECCVYLDIETTSLDPSNGDLTVVGVYLDHGNKQKVVQLVGDEISAAKLVRIVRKVKVLHTYNGKRFDLPYIKAKLGVDLARSCLHKDLMYECWRRNLFGGLKEVERKLGIKRELTGIDGRMAVQLWLDYQSSGDRRFLTTLLKYNREDILNLKALRQKLNV